MELNFLFLGANIAADLAKEFKIVPQLLMSQCIGFAILAFLLWKFAFGPIQKMLEDRRQRIIAGEEKLKQIEQQLADSEAHTAAALEKANQEAQRLIDEARANANSLSEQKLQDAIQQAQQVIAKANSAAQAEREKIVSELKSEFGRLVAATTSQVTGKVLKPEDQETINQESLKSLKA